MVKLIIGIKNCPKCLKAKEKFKNANYELLEEFSDKRRDEILMRCKKHGITSAPILFNENGNILTHEEAGF